MSPQRQLPRQPDRLRSTPPLRRQLPHHSRHLCGITHTAILLRHFNLTRTISTTLSNTIHPWHGPTDTAHPRKTAGMGTPMKLRKALLPQAYGTPCVRCGHPCSRAKSCTSTTPTGTAANSSASLTRHATSEQQPRKPEPSSSTANEPRPTRTAGKPPLLVILELRHRQVTSLSHSRLFFHDQLCAPAGVPW
jgi:hypothetical protein